MLNKIKKRDELLIEVRDLKEQEIKVVFTNGCFDLLHAGHVRYLAEAKTKGDILVVGLNSDRSVREIKGPKRPIVPEDQRAEVLASLACVDFITIFDEPDPLALIKYIVPDILVKGSDWHEEKIIGRNVVNEVVRIPLVKGISTSGIIERIMELYCN
ncbi:MAG: D-glycero-beta-D-manno-heptose 1-phosphate adenylyltransferase [Proteobacteria bacterium]|nr:D-glycero-beta-D-manno-heptose 1-phosphate adenylyltransferase [Pseudomonadota bacterium]